MRVINESRIDYKYRFSSESPIITKTIYSNIVYTTIIEDCLKVRKTVDKKIVSKYDILKYTIEILNICSNEVRNIKLKDSLGEGNKFIYNSVVINGELHTCCNIEEGILLGTLKPNERVFITFKSVVDKCLCEKDICNYCIITFDYMYNIDKPPLCIDISSNKVCSKFKEDLFKGLVIKNKFKIDSKCGETIKVINIKSEANVIKFKPLNCIINSNLLNVLLICSIKYKIYYISNGHKRVITANRGFSTNVVVPSGVKYFNKIYIKVKNENTTFLVNNRSCIFISSALLINI